MFILLGVMATVALLVLTFLWRKQRQSDRKARQSKRRILDRRRQNN